MNFQNDDNCTQKKWRTYRKKNVNCRRNEHYVVFNENQKQSQKDDSQSSSKKIKKQNLKFELNNDFSCEKFKVLRQNANIIRKKKTFLKMILLFFIETSHFVWNIDEIMKSINAFASTVETSIRNEKSSKKSSFEIEKNSKSSNNKCFQ